MQQTHETTAATDRIQDQYAREPRGRSWLYGSLITGLLLQVPWAAQAEPHNISADDIAAHSRHGHGRHRLETVTVRARQPSDPQDTHTSNTRIDGSQLERDHIDSLVDLQQLAPGLTVNAVDAFNTSVTIRGIGDGGGETSGDVNVGMPSSVAMYQDNVYLARAGMMSPNLSDIDYIQVLSGAQGTMFGDNSTGGVIDIHTRVPDASREGEIKTGIGSRGYRYAKAMFSGALSAHWNGRVDLYHARNDGNIRNEYDGRRLNGRFGSGIRGQLVYHAGDFFQLRLIADYSQANARPTGVLAATHAIDGVDGFWAHAQALGITPYISSRRVDMDGINETRTHQGGFSAQASWNFADGFRLRWVNAFRFFDYNPTTADVLSLPIYADAGTRVTDRTWQSSLRLDSPHGDIFDYATGLNFYYEKLRTVANSYYGSDAGSWYGSSAYNGLDVIRDGLLNEARWSAFFQGTFHLDDALDLSIGARDTYDRKGASFVRYHKADFNSGYLRQYNNLPSATLALNYRFDEDISAYLAISYGQKAGAVNVSAGAAKKAGYGSLFLKPETTRSAELGFKGRFDQGRIGVKADLFLAKVQNFQTQGYDAEDQQTYLLNAGSFRSRGAEGSVQFHPDHHWSIQLSGVYNDETYLDYDDARCPPEVSLAANPPASCHLTGHRVFNAPRLSANLGTRYAWHTADGSNVYLDGHYAYRSWMYGTVDDSRFTRVPGYGLLGVSVGLDRPVGKGRLDISLWANNALNKLYYTRLINSDYGAVIGYIGDSRTVGLTLDYNF